MFDDVIQQSHLRREEEEILFNKGVADSNTSVYSLTKKRQDNNSSMDKNIISDKSNVTDNRCQLDNTASVKAGLNEGLLR